MSLISLISLQLMNELFCAKSYFHIPYIFFLFFSPTQISDKAAGLYRQYVKDSLYDRISTRPFLSKEDKQWLAFQLLCALNQCHKLSVCRFCHYGWLALIFLIWVETNCLNNSLYTVSFLDIFHSFEVGIAEAIDSFK